MPQSPPANFTLYPLLWLSVGFASGILLASFLQFDWKVYLIIFLLLASLAALFSKRKITLILISIAFVAVGGLYFQIENQPVAETRIKRIYDEHRIESGDPIEIEGVLQTKPELAAGAKNLRRLFIEKMTVSQQRSD